MSYDDLSFAAILEDDANFIALDDVFINQNNRINDGDEFDDDVESNVVRNRNGYGNGGDDMEDDDDDDDDDGDNTTRKRSLGVSRGGQINVTEEQKITRREKNREHAKRSRVRKKFLLESLQQSVTALERENEKLRKAIRQIVPSNSTDLIAECESEDAAMFVENNTDATATLRTPDYGLVKAMQVAEQNFVITDPALPDNPIVFASSGFLKLTGYRLDQVRGRNCRFLQGPLTDPKHVDMIGKAITKGEDVTVCLQNYRADGSVFWNQFFCAALRDGNGKIVNYIGVQCNVSVEYVKAFNAEKTSS
jgi:PAS domain S-box-containing protein